MRCGYLMMAVALSRSLGSAGAVHWHWRARSRSNRLELERLATSPPRVAFDLEFTEAAGRLSGRFREDGGDWETLQNAKRFGDKACFDVRDATATTCDGASVPGDGNSPACGAAARRVARFLTAGGLARGCST